MPSPASKPDLTPYTGRWVALASGVVAGVGETGGQALAEARKREATEEIFLHYVEPPGGQPLHLAPLLELIEPALIEHKLPIYLVGGAVRDALLGVPSADLDFVLETNAIELAFRVGDHFGWPVYVLDRDRDVGRVVLPDHDTVLDFARMREGSLEADLQDRDFTMNAMGLPVGARTTASLIDPWGGQADLSARVVRQTHAASMQNDPVRTLRAIRMSLRYSSRLGPETRAAVLATAERLREVSVERVRDELVKLMMSRNPGRAVREMAELGLLRVALPEIAALQGVEQSAPHHEPVFEHTISVLAWLVHVEETLTEGPAPPNTALNDIHRALEAFSSGLVAHLDRAVDGGLDGRTLLRFSALFHDVGKAVTQMTTEEGRIRFLGHDEEGARLAHRRLRQLHFSNEACDYVSRIVAKHMRPLHLATAPQLSGRAVNRYFRATGPAGIDVALLSLADHLATYAGAGPTDVWRTLLSRVAVLLDNYFNHHAETVAPPPLVNGSELIEALGLQPGPEVGRLLQLIQEAQAAGEITTPEQAVQLARNQRRQSS